MDRDQMAIPIRRPRGPALVNGPPIETKRAAPIAAGQYYIYFHAVREVTHLQRWQ
jgi:hypothetical protein